MEFNEVKKKFMLRCFALRLAGTTITAYEEFFSSFEKFVKAENKLNSFEQIDTIALRRYLVLLSSTMCGITVEGYYRKLKTLYNFLLNEGLIKNNPLNTIERPKVAKRKIQTFNSNEVYAMLNAYDVNTFIGLRNYTLLSFLLATGVRRSEFVNLTIFDVDLQAVVGTTTDGMTRYPAPNWTPKDGWKVDKALVYAFVRQESCFNQRAESSVGAVGLMQIMPNTGRELAKLLSYPWQKKLLKEPEYNLSLGQNYLLRLMALPAVGNNLMFLAVAYNAGPGNLIKWKKKMKYQDDPLLFLESIPSKETRSFTERIIVNYWIYRSLMGQPLPSLDTTATGGWPAYHAVEVDT